MKSVCGSGTGCDQHSVYCLKKNAKPRFKLRLNDEHLKGCMLILKKKLNRTIKHYQSKNGVKNTKYSVTDC
jgi:hypothetical protein